ncbi:MerR family transcriptional regulator [Corynebacterium epidermidicanis]|uniref:Putative transcriptional regulator n=1 Tax=Corynebacterium epidermidicanis TaxID=1050174 RepID=A0A0G3GUY8_9CORY|nr:MerR family transcriptional regulator [Corynebacterium epidermidicanis]AKK04335.1 putative transcriptional regulator [Corynebacterium epidermidicanis]
MFIEGLQVKELAELNGTTVRTIRRYHQVGLLPIPENVGVREYGFPHVIRLARIRFLREAGLSLQQIGNMLSQTVDVQAELAATERDIDATIARLQHQKVLLAALKSRNHATQPSIPLPQTMANFYAEALSRASTAEVRRVIQRERQLVEFLIHSGAIQHIEDFWPQLLPPPEQFDLSMQVYLEFGELPELTPPEIQALATKHLSYFPPNWLWARCTNWWRRSWSAPQQNCCSWPFLTLMNTCTSPI